MDKIYEYNELLNHINNYNFKQKPIFRGESSLYETCYSSVFRLPQEKSQKYFNVMINLSSFIAKSKIFPRLENKVGYILYEGQPFGANCIINPVDCEPRHVLWGIQGLLQHYGFPTWWIDCTFNLNSALYFATKKTNSDIGYLYYIDDYDSNTGDLIDLELFAKDLKKILKFPNIRPERQKALAFRFRGSDNFDAKKKFKVLKFKKPKNKQNLDEYYFPKDALKAWFLGQFIDYYFDLLQNENYLVESESFQNSYKKQKHLIEEVITDLKLW